LWDRIYSGVYQFLDSKNKIIYIGKAKNLKKRVSSYFSSQAHSRNLTPCLIIL